MIDRWVGRTLPDIGRSMEPLKGLTSAIDVVVQSKADQLNVAKRTCHALAAQITEFEAGLNPNEEIGARFVAGSDGSVFHIENLDWITAELIRFEGKDSYGRPVRQIQHVSEVNVQLVALPISKSAPNRIGFPLMDKFQN